MGPDSPWSKTGYLGMPELTGYAERNERQRLRVIELNPSDARNCSGTLDQGKIQVAVGFLTRLQI